MKAATWVLIIGIVLMFGSCVPYGLAIKNGFTKNIAYTANLEEGNPLKTELFKVDTQQKVQVAVEINVRTPSVEKAIGVDDYEAQYRFPFSYRLLDNKNKLIHQETGVIDGESGTRSITNKNIKSTSGILTVKRNFSALQIDPPGHIQLEVILGADSTYEASTSMAKLLVYDDVHTYWGNILQGLGLGLLGFCLTLVGIIMLASRRSKISSTPDQNKPAYTQTSQHQQDSHLPMEKQVAASVPDKDARQWAMLTHLSAYSGFIIPFGGLIGPLVIWLLKKDEFHLVGSHGIEALNFRISIYIYTIISVILMFVLVGFVLLVVLFLLDLILPLVAGLRANDGEDYHYPLTIRFLK